MKILPELPGASNPNQSGRSGPTSKSPSQRDRILTALRKAGPRGLTTLEMLEAGGCRYSSRLRELRQQNHLIDTISEGESSFRYILRHEAVNPKPLPDYGATMERKLRATALPLFSSTEFRP